MKTIIIFVLPFILLGMFLNLHPPFAEAVNEMNESKKCVPFGMVNVAISNSYMVVLRKRADQSMLPIKAQKW